MKKQVVFCVFLLITESIYSEEQFFDITFFYNRSFSGEMKYKSSYNGLFGGTTHYSEEQFFDIIFFYNGSFGGEINYSEENGLQWGVLPI